MLGLSGPEIEETLTALHDRLTDISNSDRAFLEDDRPHVEAPELPVMEEIVLTGPGEVEPTDTVEPEPEMVREINRLTEGVWVEVTHEDGQKMRCKLAAIVQPGSKYIFVNRRGMKVAERNANGAGRRTEAQDDRDSRRVAGVRPRARSGDRQPASAAPPADLILALSRAQLTRHSRIVQQSFHRRYDRLRLHVDFQIHTITDDDAPQRRRVRSFRGSG